MATASLIQTSVSGGHSNALALQGDGVFLPKLNTTSRLALSLAASDGGLMVFDTTLNNLFIWNGAGWESIPASGDSTNTQIAFNDNGILAGDAGLTYDKAQARVQVGARIDIWKGLNANSTSVAVGRSALSLTQAGASANTAVGNQAGLGVTTSAGNTYVGSNAGFGGGGGFSVAVGANALQLNTGGQSNVAVGTGALAASSTASSNVAVGANALNVISNGGNNVGIGINAGDTSTTGGSNIMLGAFARTEAATSSNQICIGSTSYWVGTNGGPSTWWAGASGAIGYWRVIINGVPVKIPVYAD